MLYILCSLIILLPAFAGFGSAVHKLAGNVWEDISSKIVSGIFVVAIIFTATAFFLPLNIYVETVTLAIGLGLFFYLKLYLDLAQFLTQNLVLFLSIAFTIVFFGAGYPFILDHFGYYVPTVKWISAVGIVRGISNLDLLLGQMSVWHILQAGFSNFADSFLRLNVIMLIAYLIYILEKKSWIHLVFIPFLLLFSQSPSPDLPVIIFSLIILNEFLNGNKNYGWLFSLSVFVFILKPTMIWLPLFALLHLVFSAALKLKTLIPGILIVLLFIFKNIWTFGYPVFPVQVFDLGFSWAPNPEILKISAEMAIQKTYDMQFTAEQIQRFSFFEYVYNWLFLPGIKGIINISLIFSLLVFLIFSLNKKSKIIWLLFISILIKVIAVLLFSAQYRFFLDVFFVIFLVLFYQKISKNVGITALATLTLIIGVLLSFPDLLKKRIPSFQLANYMSGFNSSQFYKPSHFELNKFKTYEVGNLKFNVVQDYPFSFDTPLPAISPAFIQEDLDAGIFPQLRGKTLEEGFIWRKISDSEKIQLQNILDDFNSK